MSYYTDKINQLKKDKYQLQAYNTQRSTVVIAGPGSGKTTILTLKILRLLREEIQEPRGLACVTFSKEAAREFKGRLKKLGYMDRKNVFLGTVHSFCIAEVLGKFAHLYEYDIPLPIKIISNKDKKALFDSVIKDLGYENHYIKMSDMDKERILNIKGISTVEVPSYDVALKTAQEYEKRLHESGYMDYESTIKFSTVLIQEQEYVRKCLSAKFPWIIIDEYQDLGRPLHEMILALFTTTDIEIFAVGDPDQSIYGFSGAIPDYLLELYTREDIIPIKLKNNYRSNQDIIDGSEVVLNSSRGYVAATRKHERAEFRFVTCKNGLEEQFEWCVNKIIPYYIKKGTSLDEIAVIGKSNEDMQKLAEKLAESNIPCYIAKHEFDRSDFVKWLELCALWVNDKTSSSFNEIYGFWENLIIKHGKQLLDSKERIEEKKRLYEVLSNSFIHKNSIKAWIVNILEELKIIGILKSSDICPDEIGNIKKLIKVISQERYRTYDISKFGVLGKPENQVTLTTRHSSKGLEFEIVILLGMEENNFPDYRSISNPKKLEEQSRICFVCISRAKKVCVLLRSQYHDIIKKNGDVWHKPHEPSRFWVKLYEKYGPSK